MSDFGGVRARGQKMRDALNFNHDAGDEVDVPRWRCGELRTTSVGGDNA
jgi:hypothetical protein